MRCPTCGTAFHFQPEGTLPARGSTSVFEEPTGPPEPPSGPIMSWSTELASGACPACGSLVVTLRLMGSVQSEEVGFGEGSPTIVEEHVIFPPRSGRGLPAEVPERLRKDFQEAAAVMGLSPKASAALGRRILQDVLREACGCDQHDLSKQVAAYIEKHGVQSPLADQLHALREVGNFAAHTQKDTNTGAVLDVEPGEAEWLLDTLEALFDHVYVKPGKHQARVDALNAKLTAAGRRPLGKTGP